MVTACRGSLRKSLNVFVYTPEMRHVTSRMLFLLATAIRTGPLYGGARSTHPEHVLYQLTARCASRMRPLSPHVYVASDNLPGFVMASAANDGAFFEHFCVFRSHSTRMQLVHAARVACICRRGPVPRVHVTRSQEPDCKHRAHSHATCKLFTINDPWRVRRLVLPRVSRSSGSMYTTASVQFTRVPADACDVDVRRASSAAASMPLQPSCVRTLAFSKTTHP